MEAYMKIMNTPCTIEDTWYELEGVDAILAALSVADLDNIDSKHITLMMITMSSKIGKAIKMLKDEHSAIHAGAKALFDQTCQNNKKESPCLKS